MKVKLIQKMDLPKPPKTNDKQMVKLKNGATIYMETVELENEPVPATKSNGFAPLKHTKYYPLLGGWFVAITK